MRCWAYDVSELLDERVFRDALAHLPWDARRAQVLRYAFARDRCMSLGVGLLAAHALMQAGASDLALGLGEHGKPFLKNCPATHFNLSHDGTLAVCAVSDEPVGIDVAAPVAYDPGVARLCFAEGERRWMGMQPDLDAAFTRLWTRKESYLKLLGCGLCDDVRSLDVSPGSPTGDAAWFWERQIEGHAVALCSRGDRAVIVCRAKRGFWRDRVGMIG